MPPRDTSVDPLAAATLIYVAPRSGVSGVSDYADDLLHEARAAFAHVIEVRHGGAGQDSVADVRRGRAQIRRAIAEAGGPVVLHTEQSGGVLVPFWGLTMRVARGRRVVRSSTLHDAPLGVWLPFRTRFISRSRLLVHALHYPTMPMIRRWERRVLRDVHLSTLTAAGAVAAQDELRHDEVTVSFLPPPPRAEIVPAVQRPLAVGLFGYVYKGKGFDLLGALRERVDPRIGIRVAGRGTQDLDAVPGVEIVGPVDDAREDEFFASVRAIVLPYTRRSSYGPETHVASSVVARALAYGTPVIALRYPGISDEAELVDGGVDELADAIDRLIPDDDEVVRMAARSLALRARLTPAAAFERLAQMWRTALRDA